MSAALSLRERTDANARLRCTAKGCTKLRGPGHLRPYCTDCKQKKAQHGDPKQGLLPKYRLVPFLAMAKRFMRLHHSDEQVSAALATMQDLLNIANDPEPESTFPKQGATLGSKQRGRKNPAWLVWREFRRLRRPAPKLYKRGGPHSTGVYEPATPVGAEEALTAVLSVWLAYSMIGEQIFVNDGAPLTFALADSVLRLRRLPSNGHSIVPIAESTKRTVGQRLREELGVFLTLVVDTVRAEEAARLERKALMQTPIEPRERPREVKLSPTEQKAWDALNENAPAAPAAPEPPPAVEAPAGFTFADLPDKLKPRCSQAWLKDGMQQPRDAFAAIWYALHQRATAK